MTRRSRYAIAFFLTAMATVALGSGIAWVESVDTGVVQSKKSKKPILFHIVPSDSSKEDLRSQQVAFEDEIVSRLVKERFVPIPLRQQTMTTMLLDEMNIEQALPLSLIVAKPEGGAVGVIGPSDVSDAKKLAPALAKLFREYRDELYTSEIKPKLIDASIPAADFIASLKLIEALNIGVADKDLAAVLDRADLDPNLKALICETLAKLSTPAAVTTLLSRAKDDPAAAKALSTCVPAAVPTLIEQLGSKDAGVAEHAFSALASMCDISVADATKPSAEDIERVKSKAQNVAKEWEETSGAYR